ncbi:MAG TPA: hypothetical protein VN633_25650 [Bryobacteraceae bacterium]|nr:hypothetical protein [Bryobacteraceae bacterium]
MDTEEITIRSEAQAIVAETQTELVFLSLELLHIAFSADQVAVEGFEQPNGGGAIK